MKLSRLSLVLPVLVIAACDMQAMNTPVVSTATTPGGTTVTAAPTATGDAAVVIATPPGTGAGAAPTPAPTPAAATAAGRIGTTVASLGDASQPGLWLKTPLVTAAAKGRIVNPATGKSANVDLIPLAGPATGGSQASLPALQAVGASITDLPTIEVWRS